MPVLMFILGFGLFTEHRKYSIYDFICDYQPEQSLDVAPVVAINHVSFLDIFYLYRRNMSFLAKVDVGKSPIFGPFSLARQCILVSKGNPDEMHQILDRVKSRVINNMTDGNPPLIVFPEGTLSQGYSLLKFKKGAFISDKPIKILTMSWGVDDSFFASYTNIHPLMGILLVLSQPKNNLIIKELDLPLDPKFVWKKYGVTHPEEDPHAWEYVAREVKQIMAFMNNYEETEDGFKEINEFEKEECHKNDIFKVKLFSRECKKVAEDIGVKNTLNIGAYTSQQNLDDRKTLNSAILKKKL